MIGKPTIDRLLKNTMFVSNFLGPSQKRNPEDEEICDGDFDKENRMSAGAKRMRLQ